jgi:acetyl esterase/lipase
MDDILSIGLVKLGFFIKKVLSKLKITDHFYERLSKRYHYPKHIEWQTKHIEGVKTEILSHKNHQPTHCLLQLHGGAYVYDFNNNYRRMAHKYIKVHPQFKVYSPYYALAPKHPFPSALNQMVDVYKHLLKTYDPKHIIVTGDSAGGGLALALAYELYDQKLPLPKAMITMSAWTDFLGQGESYQENKDKDLFFKIGSISEQMKAYAGEYSYDHDKISPKYGDYSKLPNLLMFVGGNELIKSDTLDIGLNHSKAIVHEFSKMFHVYPLGFKFMHSARKTWHIIESYLNDML